MILHFASGDWDVQVIFFSWDRTGIDSAVGAVGVERLVEVDRIEKIRIGFFLTKLDVAANVVRFFPRCEVSEPEA